MPSITAEEAPRLKPFIKLAEVLGAFVGQVTDDPIKEVEILFDGSTAARSYVSADPHPNGEVDYVLNGTTPKPGYVPYTYPHPLRASGAPAYQVRLPVIVR